MTTTTSFHFNYDPNVAKYAGSAIAAVMLAETQGMVNENQRKLMDGMIKIGVDQSLHNSWLSAENTVSSAIAQGVGEGVQGAGYLGIGASSAKNALDLENLPNEFQNELGTVNARIQSVDNAISSIGKGSFLGEGNTTVELEEVGTEEESAGSRVARPDSTKEEQEADREKLMGHRDQHIRHKEIITKEKEYRRALLVEKSTSRQNYMNGITTAGPGFGKIASSTADAEKTRNEATAQISNVSYNAFDATRQQDEGTVKTMQDAMGRIYDGVVASSNKV